MVAGMDIQAQGIQLYPDQHDHIELERYKNNQNQHSRYTSYILNILYNANTSYWTVTGLQSLFSSFGYDFVIWPFYIAAAVFTGSNAIYDVIASAEDESYHKQRSDDLDNILPDEELLRLQNKLFSYGVEMDLVNHAKASTTEALLNEVINDYLDALETISAKLKSEELSAIEKQQLKLSQTKLQLTLRNLKEQISDKELAYRIAVCVDDNVNTGTQTYKLPLLARAYTWLSRNFYTFTTGAITTTGLATFLYTIIGKFLPTLRFLPWSIFTMIGVGVAGASINFVMNKFLFDAAKTDYSKRKNLKHTLRDKHALLKTKVKLQKTVYQSNNIALDTYIDNDTTIDRDREFHETAKLHKPSKYRQYGVPFLVAGFALYSGYGIAYSLIAPFTFLGLSVAWWVLPLIGVPLAILYGSKKGLEYKDSLDEANHKFTALKKVIPPEQINLYQQKLNLAGIDKNVADIIYDATRKQISENVITEHEGLRKLISTFESNKPANPQLREEHDKVLNQLYKLMENLNKKVDKHTEAIKNEKHKQRILDYFKPESQNQDTDYTLKERVKDFIRNLIDLFEWHYSDFFDGGSTICGIAATTLFLIMSSPGLNIIIPVLIGSFIIGGIGTMIFKYFFEDSSQYTLTNVKNTKQKLSDKLQTYKILQPTLIAKKQAQDLVSNWDKRSNGYLGLAAEKPIPDDNHHDVQLESAQFMEFNHTSFPQNQAQYDSPLKSVHIDEEKLNGENRYTPDAAQAA